MIHSLHKIVQLDQELAITTFQTTLEAVIGQRQAQEILEISVPVIQIWDGIVAVPLIGMLDTARAEQFMEKLLNRVVETNSRVALIDITGVPSVDTQTAQHIVETISAVKLIGAQVILTGVSPSIAQSLVVLGTDLSGITTRSTLSAGLKTGIKLLDNFAASEYNSASGV